MAEFKAFVEGVEVDGGTTHAFIHCMKKGAETRAAIMAKHGIIPSAAAWHRQQYWLSAFKEVAEEFGDMNLFLIGTAIIENAQFPPMNGLEDALRSIDIAYHMNHRIHGEVMFNAQTGVMLEGIGHYSVHSFDAAGRKAVMVCETPYPSKFDEGIISEIVKRFRPADSKAYTVKVDITKEQRAKGANTCTYLISW